METTSDSLALWNQYMFYGALLCSAIGVFILLYYEFKIILIKELKEKYDHVNRHEIKNFWYAIMAFILGATLIINTFGSELILEKGPRWFFVRAFISVCFLIVGYFIFHSLIRIYYPKKLSRRLHKLRNKPRVSPEGNVMRKLSEAEEDLHLESSQIKEEEIQVVDYDVWIDEKTGYKKIEKYIVSDEATECPECGYYTFLIGSEEIGKAPTDSESGYLIEHLECSYCHHKEKREVVVTQLSANIA